MGKIGTKRDPKEGADEFAAFARGVLEATAARIGELVPRGPVYADRPQTITVTIDQHGATVSTDFALYACGPRPPRAGRASEPERPGAPGI